MIKCHKYWDLVIWSSFQIWKIFSNNANVIENNTKIEKDPKIGKYRKDPQKKKPSQPETRKLTRYFHQHFGGGQSNMWAGFFWVGLRVIINPTWPDPLLPRAKIIQCPCRCLIFEFRRPPLVGENQDTKFKPIPIGFQYPESNTL